MARKIQVTELLTAPARTGKSYFSVYELCEEFLPKSKGKVYTNLPLGVVPEQHSFPPAYPGETFAERIGQHVAERHGGDASAYAERIVILDEETLQSWDCSSYPCSGPWETFRDVDLTGARFLIDEAHNFISSSANRTHKDHWQRWCGELGHQRASVQFITQSPQKLAKELHQEAGKRFSLVDAEEERDPLFDIPMLYWYELWAKLRGRYKSKFVRLEFRAVDTSMSKPTDVKRIAKEDIYFRLYDSYNAPHSGGVAATEIEKRKWETLSWPELLKWFFRENAENFAKPIGVCLVLYLLIFHGTWLFSQVTGRAYTATKADKTVVTKQQWAAQVNNGPPKPVELTGAPARSKRGIQIQGITPDSVLIDGTEYKTGNAIMYGDFKGERVFEIDYRRRRARVGSEWVQISGQSYALNEAALLSIAGPSVLERPPVAGGNGASNVLGEQMPLGQFLRVLCQRQTVSVVVARGLEFSPISLDVTDASVDTVLRLVARRVGATVIEDGGVYFIGEPQTYDRGALVSRLGNVSQVDLEKIVQLCLSDSGTAHVTQTGIIVAADAVEALAKLARVIEDLRMMDREKWLLQLHVVEVSKSVDQTLGVESAATVSALASTSGASQLEAALKATLSAVATDRGSRVVAEPLFTCVEGAPVGFTRGGRVPILDTLVSERGQTQSVRYEPMGFRVNLVVRRQESEAVVTVSVKDEAVVDGDIGPEFIGYDFESEAVVESGGCYLLGAVESETEYTQKTRGLTWLFNRKGSSVVTQFWLRAYRVGGSTFGSPFADDIVSPSEAIAERSGLSEASESDEAAEVSGFSWGAMVE